jgi:hypothetical protein
MLRINLMQQWFGYSDAAIAALPLKLGIRASRFLLQRPNLHAPRPSPARAPRFLRSKFSRLFNQAAVSSRFLSEQTTPPVEPVTTPRTVSDSRFLPPKLTLL